MDKDMSDFDPNWPYTKAKTAVLFAAASVIREQGPRSATLKNIAHRAGITEPAIFRHFAGVDGLFAGLFDICELYYTRVIEAYASEKESPSGFFRAMEKAVDILAQSREFAYLIIYADQIFGGYEDLRIRSLELKKRDEALACARLDEAVKRGELKAGILPETVAFATIGVIHMTIVTWINADFSFDLAEYCKRRVANLEELFSADL
jgi:AcrR family transcriptional regulator